MPYHFQYVPPSGPLSGRALEEQTERAFNELGAEMDAFQESAAEALDVATNAHSTAVEALGTANRAITEVQDAATAAQVARTEAGEALSVADEALSVAQDARSAVNMAIDTADSAIGLAEEAHVAAQNAELTAEEAQKNARDAADRAENAEAIAQSALGLQSEDFWADDSSIDADVVVDSQRVYATTEILNTPVTAPAYLQAMASSDDSSVTQAVWGEANPMPFLRSGKITRTANAGSSDFEFTTVLDDENAGPSGTLAVTNNGAVMSGAFAPGTFAQSSASAFSLEGVASFTVGADFSGIVMWDGEEIVRIADGEAILMNLSVFSDNVNVTLITATYSGDTLSLQIVAEWLNKNNVTTWGAWIPIGGGGGDIPDVIPIANGGTGATTAAQATINLGINLTSLGVTYGTAELTPGTSALATGKIYLVYM